MLKEGHLYIPDNTTRRSEESLSAVAVCLDSAEEVKDGVKVWDDELS